MNYWKILGHLLINVSWHLLVLHGFGRYVLEFLTEVFGGNSLNVMRGCKTSREFSTILLKKFFYTALSLFAVTEQGLNVIGHLSSALYLYECKLHRTEPVLQVVLLHALVALKNS